MAYDRVAVKIMSMSDEVWRRHANPWSGWTRMATAPFWFVAMWSWTWIGWWCLLPITVLSIWTWLNPRVFSPCSDDRAWITKGVLGEQIFLKRKASPIPAHHLRMAHTLTALSTFSFIACVVGLVMKSFWLALGGWLLCVVFKMWFVDRMVWLYTERASVDETTRSS